MRSNFAGATLILTASLTTIGGCKRAAPPGATSDARTTGIASAAPSPGASSAVPSATPSLPEDPEAAARSLERWREHLEEEERERRLHFDRRKLPEHEAVVAKLQSARADFDRAESQAQLERARLSFLRNVADLERRFDHIDHWGNNSAVLADYAEIVKLLTRAYPAARRAALSGNSAEFVALQAEVARRFGAIEASLKEARESVDE